MRIPLLAVPALALLTACSGTPTPATPAPPTSSGAAGSGPAGSGAAGFDDPAPAAAADKIGPGTACPIPATIPTAAKWKPKDATSANLTTAGVTLRCEIDAKPAGVLGFIRVYTYDGADPTQALTAALATPGLGGTKTTDRRLTIAGKPGIEATLKAESSGPGRAFAAGGVVLVWRGVDTEEFQSGLPAYVLARTSITFP